MSEKKKCPCPKAINNAAIPPRDRMDIEWLVEQRVQRTLAAKQSYNTGLYDGIIYSVFVISILILVFWPEVKKVVAVP
jgi:hypothetical protein